MQHLKSFNDITGCEPYPMQQAMWERVTSDDCAVLLKSPTGSGKTEAVLAPSLWTVLHEEEKKRRLFMVYPARSLVEDQIGRIEKTFKHLSQDGKRLSLVVDTGGQSARRLFEDGKEVTDRQFNSRRHLYDGDVIVTTLDKFLYRFFGFGDERKGYIFPFRIFHGLRRNLFVFDEAHAYEDTAFTNFVRLIKTLYTANLDVVVMTATMPDDYAKELNFLQTVDFLSDNQPHPKILLYVPLPDKTAIADAVAEQAQIRRANHKRLIVTVETVEDAVEVWEQLGKPLLYHGRLDGWQRRKVYGDLKQREDSGEGYLLVTTSAIEVGCDLNADCLITEICNPASLIQRAGRCNRRGDRDGAEIVVVGNAIKSFLCDISEEQEAAFVQTLNEKNGQLFQPADFFCFMKRGVAFDYRAEILFDMLFEYVYEGRLENKPLHDKGLVVTRSWEPSVTLTTCKDTMSHAVSVPISRCVARKEADWDKSCPVYVRYFNRKFYAQNEYEIAVKPMEYGGWAYFRDIVIEVDKDQFDPKTGYVTIPKPFRRWRPEGYRETLAFQALDGKPRTLYYLHWKPEPPDEQEVTSAPAETGEEPTEEATDDAVS